MSGDTVSNETASTDSPGKALYVLRSTVWFDELDMVGVLHNARYAIHVERAMTALYHSLTGLDPSDSYVVVKHYEIEFVRQTNGGASTSQSWSYRFKASELPPARNKP